MSALVIVEGPLEFMGGMFFLGRWPNDGLWVIQRRSNIDTGRSASTFKGEDEARSLWRELQSGQKCHECGAGLEWERNMAHWAKLQERSLCHSCNFWMERIANHNTNTAVIGGDRFTIAPDAPQGHRGFVGHGGAEFTIRFYDGREVTTHNLWAQGRIPEHFRARYQDNAEFVKAANHGRYIGHGSAVGAAVTGGPRG